MRGAEELRSLLTSKLCQKVLAKSEALDCLSGVTFSSGGGRRFEARGARTGGLGTSEWLALSVVVSRAEPRAVSLCSCTPWSTCAVFSSTRPPEHELDRLLVLT